MNAVQGVVAQPMSIPIVEYVEYEGESRNLKCAVNCTVPKTSKSFLWDGRNKNSMLHTSCAKIHVLCNLTLNVNHQGVRINIPGMFGYFCDVVSRSNDKCLAGEVAEIKRRYPGRWLPKQIKKAQQDFPMNYDTFREFIEQIYDSLPEDDSSQESEDERVPVLAPPPNPRIFGTLEGTSINKEDQMNICNFSSSSSSKPESFSDEDEEFVDCDDPIYGSDNTKLSISDDIFKEFDKDELIDLTGD